MDTGIVLTPIPVCKQQRTD